MVRRSTADRRCRRHSGPGSPAPAVRISCRPIDASAFSVRTAASTLTAIVTRPDRDGCGEPPGRRCWPRGASRRGLCLRSAGRGEEVLGVTEQEDRRHGERDEQRRSAAVAEDPRRDREGDRGHGDRQGERRDGFREAPFRRDSPPAGRGQETPREGMDGSASSPSPATRSSTYPARTDQFPLSLGTGA